MVGDGARLSLRAADERIGPLRLDVEEFDPVGEP